MAASPHISTQTLTLELSDPALPIFYAQLTLLRDSILLNVGSQPLPFGIAQDFSCAMKVNVSDASIDFERSLTH